MLQGSEAEDADTLFEGKGTKNNRDFQISRKIFQSVIGKISVLLFILSTQFLGNFQRLSDLLYQSLETYAVISQICKFFLNEFIRLGCNGSTLEEHAVNFLAKTISSPSTRRRHCQIETLQLKDLLPEEPLLYATMSIGSQVATQFVLLVFFEQIASFFLYF